MLSWAAAAAAAVGLAAATPAAGQVVPVSAGRPLELTLGGTWSAPVSAGSLNADFFTSTGGTFTQFEVDNRLGQGFGLDVRVGTPLGASRRFWVEGVGALARTSLQTEITRDSEDGEEITVSENALRYVVGGAARWVLSQGQTGEWFLRVGAGWLREVAAGSALVEDGLSTDVGAGWTYVLRDRPRGGLRRLGLRLDGRLEMRSGGVSFGEDSLRIGPVVGGALTMGFR